MERNSPFLLDYYYKDTTTGGGRSRAVARLSRYGVAISCLKRGLLRTESKFGSTRSHPGDR